MKKEGTIGTAAFLAIAAMVGLSVQTGLKPSENSGADRSSALKRSKPSPAKARENLPGCGSLREELEDFLEIQKNELHLPDDCYENDDPARKQAQPDLAAKTSQLRFVIALLPDPVHTHLPVVFDQFAVAIQEGAQDEKYDFDGSWLPWDDEDTPYALFLDEKAANREKELKETQPGIILFRKTIDCGKRDAGADDKKNQAKQKDCRDDWEKGRLSQSYREGLVVFVVGEEATHGIHEEQFRNALGWIKALRPTTEGGGKPLAILGPTFSGSLPSLKQVLSETNSRRGLNLVVEPQTSAQKSGFPKTPDGGRLAVFSGSVSSSASAEGFQNSLEPHVVFHSFVQNDDEILHRFCRYMELEQPGFDPARIAMISEDETAYGVLGAPPDKTDCSEKALRLYYPRDISALRSAYQTRSLFDAGAAPQSADTQKRNLPTDLADPAGKVHDSIRNYGGNQTPLTQEAFLMDLVAALRELHARYILLRSSNTLDQLFLSNFLRRSYPDGRIVIFGSDLMFIRERGATGLNGSMTLSTYPLFPLEHRWTDHQRLAAADRVFSADTSEGTYVAFRLLLNDRSLNEGLQDNSGCHVRSEDEGKIFLPSIACAANASPIPDYSPPFWTLVDQCGEKNETNKDPECAYPGPATWLSVIGVNRFWPMASLTHESSGAEWKALGLWTGPEASATPSERANDPGGRPEIPLGMKVLLFILAGFSLFHAGCCWFGSYTAKPAFRAHFASEGDWRHSVLIFAGSACVAFLAIVAGWGCGVFTEPATGLAYPWLARCCVTFTCLMALGAVVGNGYTVSRLTRDATKDADFQRRATKRIVVSIGVAIVLLFVAMYLFYRCNVFPAEGQLRPENRVLTYWRAMHLASGVSPIVPVLAVLAGLYVSFWFALHGLALFGSDRPCLPPKGSLALQLGTSTKDFLRMFSQEDAAKSIEDAAIPLDWKIAVVGPALFVLFLLVPWSIAGGVPVRSLGAESFAIIFLVWLDVCCTVALIETWRLYGAWDELRRLLAFLDRLPLRRTLAVLHGFSWGSVWKMSGNVLEVRYKVISRQLECTNHTIASLQELLKSSHDPAEVAGTLSSLTALTTMHRAGIDFAEWYSTNYTISRAGDLTKFREFQQGIAAASGTLLTKLLVPAWMGEKGSLIASPVSEAKEDAPPSPPPQAKKEHIRNAEEFVCLNYLGFVQNVLGRLRTMAMTIVALFLAATVAISTYPFDPRQALSIILIVLFVATGVVIVKVYAEMHRDATLSHVTNTKPGELGTEFWFKIVGFGFAPLLGLLTRVFPGIAEFIFSWIQPGLSSLK
ncbi:MAG TPA: hypothetical protein VK525_17895 [Candidatus Saccharimonadales bacterium]|nr:hypothetical protein [Candidatus Saccharimonadales bacterium]